ANRAIWPAAKRGTGPGGFTAVGENVDASFTRHRYISGRILSPAPAAMSLGASIVCAAEGKASGLVSALTAAVRYRVVAVRFADAPAKPAAAQPAAIVVADPQADPALVAAIVQQTEELEGPFVPILVHRPAEPDVSLPLLPIIDAAPARVVARLTAALRIRTLHATV